MFYLHFVDDLCIFPFYYKLGSSLVEFKLEHCNCVRKILVEKLDLTENRGNNVKQAG